MDLEVTIIGVFLMLLFLLPIIIVSRNSKSDEKKTVKALYALAANTNCSISQFEILRQIIMGIDTKNSKVFFIRKTSNSLQEQVINLSDIKECKVVSFSKSKKTKGLNNNTVDSVELSFIGLNSKKQNFIFDIYNADKDRYMTGDEIKFAEKWKNSINKILANNALNNNTKAS